jgi:hypothetical protein
MAESAALLVDDVLPHESIKQWVLSFPFQLRFLFASYPQIMGKVLGIVYRTLATHLTKKAGYNKQIAQTGAVTLIQRFGSALNLNIHLQQKLSQVARQLNERPRKTLNYETPAERFNQCVASTS